MFNRKKSTKDLVQAGSGRSRHSEPEPYGVQEDAEPTRKAGKAKKEKRPKKTRSGKSNFFKTKYFIGICCIVLAVAMSFGAIPVLVAQTNDLITVLVFNQNVSSGQTVHSDMLKSVEMSNYNLPLGVQTEQSAVLGKYLTADVIAGDIVTSTRLSQAYPGDDPELANLPDGKMALSVTLSNMSQSLSSKIRAGDVIRLYSVQKDAVGAAGYAAVSLPELQYVKVLDTADSAGYDVTSDLGNTIETVILLVNQEQAAALVYLEGTAAMYAALVTRGNDELSTQLLAAQDAFFAEEAPNTEDSEDGAANSVTPVQTPE